MLPVVDKPLIQYVVEECIASGIESIIIVTGRGKNAIEDHFDSSPELERFLEARGKTEQAEMVRAISNMVHFSYTRQKDPLGLGHAVLIARELVGDEPFAVLLGDVIIPGCAARDQRSCEIYEDTGLGTIAVEPCPQKKRIFTASSMANRRKTRNGANICCMCATWWKSPSPAEAPSNLAVTGRYVLPPEIFDCLERTQPGRGGEIQLTDGLRLLAKETGCLADSTKGNLTMREINWAFLRPPWKLGSKWRIWRGISVATCGNSSFKRPQHSEAVYFFDVDCFFSDEPAELEIPICFPISTGICPTSRSCRSGLNPCCRNRFRRSDIFSRLNPCCPKSLCFLNLFRPTPVSTSRGRNR